jgi:hypothetical protein
MVLLHEAISGRAHILILGQKEVKSHKKIALFFDLNSIYRCIDLKLWNIKIVFSLIFQSYKKNQVSQLLVHATACINNERHENLYGS